MAERIEHFSHEHPLCLFQVDADKEPKPYRCRICGLPILSSPSYTCSINADCNFFVHKPCTQLPKKFHHTLHLEDLNLEEPSDAGESFRYNCWNHSHCKFDLHPLVAQPVEIKTHHKSHESHPLVAFCKEIASLCNGCGEEERGFFFHCQVCNFWIHQDCTILASVVKLTSHPHPFVLAYSLPFMTSHSSPENHKKKCSICRGEWRLPNGGVYLCCECYSLAHVACAKPSIEDVIADTEILHLPDEEDTFPSLTIRRFVKRNTKNIKLENKMMMKYHQHPLVLENAREGACDEYNVCDVCIQPINMRSYPFYRCHDCHFLAHPICANLLPDSFNIFLGMFWPDRLEALLHGDQKEYLFSSIIPCGACYRPCNGFHYKIRIPSGTYYLLDVECAVTPRIIKHASHKQHILFLTTNLWISGTNWEFSCCPGGVRYGGIYRCVVCDYSIHVRCALLPKTTPHKFDDHPLQLITNHNKIKLQHLFCEVCEQEIELSWWYYGCSKCEHQLHSLCWASLQSQVRQNTR